MSYAERLSPVAQSDLQALVDEVRKIAVFTDLPQEHLEWFVSNCREASFATGEIVYKEGTPAEYMSIFLEGRIFARRESDGADSPVFIVGKGDVTGLLPFSRMTHLTITGRAEEPVHLLLFPATLFQEMFQRMPPLGKRLVGLLTDEALAQRGHALKHFLEEGGGKEKKVDGLLRAAGDGEMGHARKREQAGDIAFPHNEDRAISAVGLAPREDAAFEKNRHVFRRSAFFVDDLPGCEAGFPAIGDEPLQMLLREVGEDGNFSHFVDERL